MSKKKYEIIVTIEEETEVSLKQLEKLVYDVIPFVITSVKIREK